ncbi:MAG: ABC transporter substrate-binding protein [Actinomycetota bacterium]
MHHHRLVAVLAALVLVAASCGGSDDASLDSASASTAASDEAEETPSTTADEQSSEGGNAGTETDADAEDDGEAEDDPADPDEPEATATVEPVEFPLTVTDAVGREVTVDRPARIGCYWTGCTEILASLGVVPAAAAIPGGTTETDVFYYPVGPPEFVVTNINDFEAWAGADISFIINRGPEGAQDAIIDDFVDRFYLHAPGLTDTDLTGYDAHIANIRLVGQVTGLPEEAEAAVARLESAIAALGELSTPELADRSFAYLFNGEGYRVMTDETPFCAAIAEAAVATCLPLSEGELNAEAFLQLDPDVIAVQAGFNDVGYTTETRDDPTWDRLSAVQNGTAYDSDDRLYWCCGPRSLIWALQDFAAYAIPDSGVPAPGPLAVFDPATSPLVTG